ncbi:hypothetical protein ElyMa_005241400 [Elysia marginata]|uniref:Uncharacterized protein n=1 Tax=Elysia marginata TaxID=1093978 RepID=A0AAV4JYM1_9GAST|nr:hypothetical protein ElyMa_005241400 [Elysia marginata]
MESTDAAFLQELVSQLEYESQLFDNKTAKEYLTSLQQYLDTVTVTYMYMHSKDTQDYDTNAGIAWVVAVPIIFFGSVALVTVLLLVFLRHSETFKVQDKHDEQTGVAEAALHSSDRVDAESVHGQERAVVIDYNGNSATSKGSAFLRGYVNAAGELEGASRASGASKGSVRSLGVLADLNDGGIPVVRPYFHGLHPNPPSAPSTLTRHGLNTFELLTRRRLSRSIDQLAEEERPAVVHSEWSGLGAVGGRTSLEMNVTSEVPQLTLLGSDLASQEFPSVKTRSNSADGLNENASCDSLRASMELHRSRGSGSGLRADDLYGLQDRTSGPLIGDNNRKIDYRRQKYSISSSSLDSGSRSASRFGNINLSFVKSDPEIGDSQTGSNTYTEIQNFNKPYCSKSDENINYVNYVVKQPQKLELDSHLVPLSIHQPVTSRKSSEDIDTARTKTNTVGSNTADIHPVGQGSKSNWSRGQEKNCPPQTNGSWTSTDDVASCSYRSRSPLQRGRPLSLDMLSSWSRDAKNQERRAMRNAPRKQVTRQLFATTPQMSKKRFADFSLFVDPATQSAPSRHADENLFNFELKTFRFSPETSIHNVGRLRPFLADYSSSNSNTQESSAYLQEIAFSGDKPHIKMKTLSSPDHSPFLKVNTDKAGGQFKDLNCVEKNTDFRVGSDQYITNLRIQKSSFTDLREAHFTTTSDQSIAASAWTSPCSSEHHRVHLGQNESSADSTIESISSSLAPFHAKILDGIEMPRGKYQLPHEVGDTDGEPDEDRSLASYTRPELNLSLDPNPGSSCEQSPDETSRSRSPALPKSKTHVPGSQACNPTPSQSSRVSTRKPPPIPVPRRHESLLELARNVFSRSSCGPATATGPSSPRRSLELESSTISAESISDGVIHDRRVTAEQRLSEYGFIKSLAGRATFVINPSPGKFSGRTGQAEHDHADWQSQQEIFEFSNSTNVKKDIENEVFHSANAHFEHRMIESSNEPTEQITFDSFNSFVVDFQQEKKPLHGRDTGTCQSCKAQEIHDDEGTNFQELQESCSVDGNNNSLTKKPLPSNVVLEELNNASRPSVLTLKYRFQQREDGD